MHISFKSLIYYKAYLISITVILPTEIYIILSNNEFQIITSVCIQLCKCVGKSLCTISPPLLEKYKYCVQEMLQCTNSENLDRFIREPCCSRFVRDIEEHSVNYSNGKQSLVAQAV